MSDDPQTTGHPFDVLASYVDGSATPTERAVAEAHLQTCDRCRRDVALASTGRSAVRALAEVEAPGLVPTVAGMVGIDETPVAAGPAALISATDEDGSAGSNRRARRWQAVWGAGVAAAAVLAAVLIYMGVVSGGNSGGQAAGPLTRAPSDTAGATGATFDTKAIDRLAASLAGGSAAPAPAALPSVAGGAERLSSAEAVQAESCVRSAGAVDPSATLDEVLPANFQGTLAYVGAFQTSNQVQVIVASRIGCQPLYVAAARKG